MTQYEKYETLFALSNGYLGARGSFEEDGINCGPDGFYMNGFYESYPLSYGETFPAYPATSQAMVNLPNPKRLKLSIDGELFSLAKNPPLEYERTLDMKSAILSRNLIYPLGNGKKSVYNRSVLSLPSIKISSA